MPTAMVALLSFFGMRRRAASRATHPGTVLDRQIAARLADMLEASWRPVASDLRFLVYHGTVILQGQLTDPIARAAVISAVSAAPGVRRVIDRLTPELVIPGALAQGSASEPRRAA